MRVPARRRWWWAVAGAVLAAVAVLVGVLVAGGGGGGRDATIPQATGTTSSGPATSATPSTPGPADTAVPAATPSSRTATTAPSTTAPAGVPPELRGQDLTVLPTSRRVVALTFDAGANSAALTRILATLDDEGVPATFFLTGQWAAANPSGVAAIRSGGHRIGNHSMTHPHFPGLSDDAIRDQLSSAERAIAAGGADPRPLFRFPFGDRDARTVAAVNDGGYVPVRWTVDTLGWQGTSGGRSAQEVTDRVVGALQPGEIVLMHVGSNPDDGSTLDADALPSTIARTRDAGYGFVTLDALFG
ncbi:polysaccharide deacetylase family protein [Geodermatophilus sp. SYSU D01186]